MATESSWANDGGREVKPLVKNEGGIMSSSYDAHGYAAVPYIHITPHDITQFLICYVWCSCQANLPVQHTEPKLRNMGTNDSTKWLDSASHTDTYTIGAHSRTVATEPPPT